MFTVRDTVAPTLSGVPADATVECDAVPAPAPVTAADSCDPAPIVVLAEEREDGSCAGNYTFTRTWTATDRCGNATSDEQVLTVRDTRPPVVTPGTGDLFCLWPANHRYVCFDASDFEPLLADACSGIASWELTGCASDQPDDAEEASTSPWGGDGNTRDDCVVLPDRQGFCVRAERASGGPGAEAGRRYAVSVAARDGCGNASAPGTPAYMSPEQVNGERADALSDVFSPGVLLHEALAGSRPFRGATTAETLSQIVRLDPVPVEKLVADVPAALARAVGACLRKRPEDRSADGADVLRVLGGGAVARPRAWRRWAAGAALAGVTALVALLLDERAEPRLALRGRAVEATSPLGRERFRVEVPGEPTGLQPLRAVRPPLAFATCPVASMS